MLSRAPGAQAGNGNYPSQGAASGWSGSWSSLCRPLWLISLLVGNDGACSVLQPGELAEMRCMKVSKSHKEPYNS